MTRFKKGGLTAVLALAAVACSVSVASAAVLSTSSNTSPYTGTVQARASGNLTFKFSTGTITCVGPYSAIGNGSITNANIGSSFATNGTLTSLYFGKTLGLGATASTSCDTSTIPSIASCKTRTISNVAVQARTNSGNTGVDAQLGPLTVIADCIAKSDGSAINGCTYSTGAGSAAAIVGAGTYSGTPAKASTLTFTNQPFFKTTASQPAACPAAAGTSTSGVFNGSFDLYNGTGSGAAQISAYK